MALNYSSSLEHKKQIENLITLLLFLGLFFSLMFLYFAQERLFNSITTGVLNLGPEKYLRIFSVIIIYITVILSIFIARTKYLFSIYFAYLLLLIYIILNFIVSGADLTDMAQFMDTRGIGTWICLGLIFVSYHKKRYAFFIRFLVFSAVFISLLSLFNFYNFGVGLWRGQALGKYQIYATNLVWIVPYIFLMLKFNPRLKWLRFIILIMGIILALVIQTRSFLLIYLITILFDFYHTKNKRNYIILIGVTFIGFIYLVLNTEMLNSSLDLLVNRGLHDTRSEQLFVFLSQLNIVELITGGGFFTSYTFGRSQWYAVDNQWLYLLWWGGLIPVLSYFYLSVVIPLKLLLRGNLAYETKVECFVLILWVLALAGLAIFSTMTVGFCFFVISIIHGRVLFKYGLIKK